MTLQKYLNKLTKPLLGVLLFITFIPVSQAESIDYREHDIETLQALMQTGELSSRQLVEFYLARIESVDRNGPRLNSIIEINPQQSSFTNSLTDLYLQGPASEISELLDSYLF